MFCLLIANVGFWRLQIAPVGGVLHTSGLGVDEAGWHVPVASLGQQHLDYVFGFVIFAVTEMVIPNVSLLIDEVMRRPILVIEGLPDLEIAIDRHRVGNAKSRTAC